MTYPADRIKIEAHIIWRQVWIQWKQTSPSNRWRSEFVLARFAEKEAWKQNDDEVGNSLMDSDVSSESLLL